MDHMKRIKFFHSFSTGWPEGEGADGRGGGAERAGLAFFIEISIIRAYVPDVSAKKEKKSKNTRFPGTEKGWFSCIEEPTGQREKAPLGIAADDTQKAKGPCSIISPDST